MHNAYCILHSRNVEASPSAKRRVVGLYRYCPPIMVRPRQHRIAENSMYGVLIHLSDASIKGGHSE
jgi:hypothetical protein